MENNKMEIRFEIDTPFTIDDSHINTMILCMRDLTDAMKYGSKYECVEQYNEALDTIITCAESLKIKRFVKEAE